MIFEDYNKVPMTESVALGDVIYVNCKKEYVINFESKVSERNYITSEFFRYFDEYISTTFISDKTIPYMIVTAEGNFTHLDNIKLNQQTIDYVNKNGLEIYLWETPNLKDGENDNFFTDGEEDYYRIDNDKDFQRLAGFPNGTKTTCYEIETVDKFIQNNFLTNVLICTGIYKFGHHKTRDVNLSAQCNITHQQPVICEYNINEEYTTDIQSKLISFNKRYDFFRELVAAHLINKDCRLSFFPRNTDLHIVIDDKVKKLCDYEPYWQDINLRAWENINDLLAQFPDLEDNIKTLNNKSHTIDKITEDFGTIDYADEYHFPTYESKSAFCSVVNECTFAWPYAHISEKILMPIKVYRPFLLVGPAHSLEYLKSLGFQTFDRWFDESYDTETDHVKRMSKLLIEIDKVNNYTYNECKDMLNDMKDILEHNFHNLQYLLKQEGI